MIDLTWAFLLRITFLALLSGFVDSVQAQLKDYLPITAKKTGIANPLSPDPIIDYTWADPRATDSLENYRLQPVSWTSSNLRSFNTGDFKKNEIIAVNGEGDLRFDFGQTNAAWLEFLQAVSPNH